MGSSKEYMKEYNQKYYLAKKEEIKSATKSYRVNNRSKYNEQKRNWNAKYAEKREKIRRKYREKIRFDSMRQFVLERDGFKCTQCSSDFDVHVHHKDGNNHTKSNPNHKPDNLITLCHSCHSKLHYEQLGHPRFR